MGPEASIPLWGNNAFSPVSDFPYFRKKFGTPWKIFPILPFSYKFSSAEISDDLF